MPGTFSVPARRPRSWPPPAMQRRERQPRRATISAPTPCGPPSLCAERRHEIGAERAQYRPRSCRRPAPRRNGGARPAHGRCRAAAATGWIAPVSLLASISETSAGRGSARAAVRAPRDRRCPSAVAGSTAASGAAARTESCSIAETSTRRPGTPRSASWLASVPPLVKTTSVGRRADQGRHRVARRLERAGAPRGPSDAPRRDCRSAASASAMAAGDLRPHAARWRSSRDRPRLRHRARRAAIAPAMAACATARSEARRCGRARAARTTSASVTELR